MLVGLAFLLTLVAVVGAVPLALLARRTGTRRTKAAAAVTLLAGVSVLIVLGGLLAFRAVTYRQVEATSPEGDYRAVVDRPFQVMETVTRVRVLATGWSPGRALVSLCSESTDSAIYLRWDGERSLTVIAPSGTSLATIEVTSAGDGKVLSAGAFHDC